MKAILEKKLKELIKAGEPVRINILRSGIDKDFLYKYRTKTRYCFTVVRYKGEEYLLYNQKGKPREIALGSYQVWLESIDYKGQAPLRMDLPALIPPKSEQKEKAVKTF